MRDLPRGDRIQVLAEADGTIIAGLFVGRAEGDNPPHGELVPDEGQIVCEVELPEELVGEDGLDLEAFFAHRLDPGTPSKLTRR